MFFVTSTADGLLQIHRVVVGFFVALDTFDIDRALSLMTDDVEWVRESGTVRGREEVRRSLNARSRQRRTRHLVANVDVRSGGQETAHAHCDILVYQGMLDVETGPVSIKGPDLLLSNVDDLVRVSGHWKIRRKTPTTVFKFIS